MKLIVAIVRRFTIEKLVVAFEDIENFPGMTVTDAAGFGKGPRSAEVDVLDPFRRNKRIEIAANDEMVERIVEAIKTNAHTGRKGDGIILVISVQNAHLV